MTPPTDTAATLWSAIDAYGCDAAWHGALGKDATTRAAIDRAITAHVEAEVARRLAAAPEVEAAIEQYTEEIAAAGDRAPIFGPAGVGRAALRAAIAADKARAVESPRISRADALRLVDAHGDSVRRTERAAARIGTTNAGEPVTEQMVTAQIDARDAVIDALTGGADTPARPTPDEARRLVEAFAAAHGALVLLMHGGQYDPFDDEGTRRSAADTARTALLRALGVEA